MEKFPTTKEEKSDQSYLDLLKDKVVNLQSEKERAESELRDIQDDKPVSTDDVGSQRDDRERLEGEIRNTEDLIIEGERALRWVQENGFICAVCQKPIERDRLDADPASITCKEHRDEEDTIEV
jgi:RNA polymerase-binding transcription factor DksA